MSGAITQSGPVAPGHVATFIKNGVVQDGGPAGNGTLGELGITNDGSLAFAINSGAVSGPYIQYGLSVSSDGTAAISLDSFNGAPDATLTYIINGTTYGFPGTGNGDVLGPASSVSGHLAAFNGTMGTLLEDSGVVAADVVTASNGGTISAAMVPVVESSTTSAALETLGVSAAMVPVLEESTTTAALEALGVSAAMVPVVGTATTPAALAAMGAPQYLANIAALRALTVATQPTSNFTMGYTTSGDGGGGLYVYVASDTTSTDNGGTIIVDAANRRWYLAINDGPLNIMQFGGVPDGTTDNITAFINALGALPQEGGSIYFPRGNFSFSEQIVFAFLEFTASLEIFGAGPSATTFTFPNSSGGIQINFIVPASPTGNGYGSANSVNIHDMMFVTAQAGTADGITLNMSGNQQNSPSSGQNVISNVFFQGIDGPFHSGIYWRNEINVAGVSYVNLISVCGYGDGTRAHGNGLTVSGSTTNPAVVFNCFGCSWNTEKIGINYGEYAQGVAAIGCNFTGTTFGIAAQAGLPDGQQVQLTVVGCQFNCFSSCIAGTSQITTVLISTNLFFVETGAENSAISGGFEGFTITGNYLFGPADGTAVGIFIDTNTLSRGGLITGNSIGGFGTGIDLEAGSGGVNVQSNQYFANTANTINSGTGNTIGGGSP